MSLVIDCPDVDDFVEFADDELVVMVRDITGEIGWVAVGANDYLILVILWVLTCKEPFSAISYGDIAFRVQLIKYLLRESTVV